MTKREQATRALAKIHEAAELLRDDDSDRAIVVLLALSIAKQDLQIVIDALPEHDGYAEVRPVTNLHTFARMVRDDVDPDEAARIVRGE